MIEKILLLNMMLCKNGLQEKAYREQILLILMKTSIKLNNDIKETLIKF